MQNQNSLSVNLGSVGTLNGKIPIKLYSWLHDTILNPAVPTETILEVNKSLLELEEATIDVVKELQKDVNTEDGEETDNESELWWRGYYCWVICQFSCAF